MIAPGMRLLVEFAAWSRRWQILFPASDPRSPHDRDEIARRIMKAVDRGEDVALPVGWSLEPVEPTGTPGA